MPRSSPRATVWIPFLVATLALPGASFGTRASTSAVAQPHRPTPRPAHRCTLTLAVRQTEGASGCWIDERVTHAPGVLTYACGDGPAAATFGTTSFTGEVSHGVATLQLHTRFHYGDGCDWGTTQEIHGSPEDPTMQYTYTEYPMEGQHGCLPPCHATASVTVQRP